MADDKIKETISALIDGELGDEALRETLGRIDETRTRRETCWRNYHLIGDAMRGSLPERMDVDLLDRIRRAIADEVPIPSNVTPLPARPERPPRKSARTASPRTVRPVAGFALAASVAAAAYVGVGMIGMEEEPGAGPAVAAVGGTTAAAPAIPAAEQQPPSSVAELEREAAPVYRWDIARPAMESRLDGYLSNHQAAAVAAGMQSKLMPDVRMVVLEQSVIAQQ